MTGHIQAVHVEKSLPQGNSHPGGASWLSGRCWACGRAGVLHGFSGACWKAAPRLRSCCCKWRMKRNNKTKIFWRQLVLFIRAQGWDLPEQLFLFDPKAWWDLEIPPSIMLIVEEQFLSILLAGKGRGTSQNEQGVFCWQHVTADLDSHWWPGGVRLAQSACPRAVGGLERGKGSCLLHTSFFSV